MRRGRGTSTPTLCAVVVAVLVCAGAQLTFDITSPTCNTSGKTLYTSTYDGIRLTVVCRGILVAIGGPLLTTETLDCVAVCLGQQGNYVNNMECVYTFSALPSQSITLRFSLFYSEANHDVLTVRETLASKFAPDLLRSVRERAWYCLDLRWANHGQPLTEHHFRLVSQPEWPRSVNHLVDRR